MVTKSHLNYSADVGMAAGFAFGTAMGEKGISSMSLRQAAVGFLGF